MGDFERDRNVWAIGAWIFLKFGYCNLGFSVTSVKATPIKQSYFDLTLMMPRAYPVVL